MFSCLKNNLLAAAVAGSLIAASSASAFTADDRLDGAWYNPAKNDRGVLVDMIGSVGTFYVYTYNTDGKPVWLIASGEVNGEGALNDADLYYFENGVAGKIVGKTNVAFSGCTALDMSIDLNDDAGIADDSFDFQPISANPMCSSATLDSCPEGTTADGDNCKLPNSIDSNLYLPAGKYYIVDGGVYVESGATLTVAPGVTVMGADTATPNFLAVKAGGKIYANGTATNPITFRGPMGKEYPGSWAGVVLAGNSICNDAANGAKCQFEAIPSIEYGGDDLTDSSGSLSYVRILHAGYEVKKDEELNALTLLGVGSGTKLDHIQVDNGKDDGVEFFGGSVNASYIVCSNMSDDCLDLDQGYAGKIQFALVYQGNPGEFSSDPRGIEADNDSNNNDKEPRTSAILSNITLVGGAADSAKADAIHLRRGFGGQVWNSVATGYNATCLNIADIGTYNAKDKGLALAGNWIGNCNAGAINDHSSDAENAYDSVGLYNGGSNNGVQDDLMLDGYMPKADAGYLTNGLSVGDSFFAPVPYSGAFSGPSDDWTKGWTVPFKQ